MNNFIGENKKAIISTVSTFVGIQLLQLAETYGLPIDSTLASFIASGLVSIVVGYLVWQFRNIPPELLKDIQDIASDE